VSFVVDGAGGWWYLLHMKQNKPTKQTVKVLGYTVTVGSKKHAKLLAQVKHFNDLGTRNQ